MTWEIVHANRDKPWDWKELSWNPMLKYKEKWINDKRLQTIKALQIQRHWRNCTSNPEYKLAQKLIKDRLDY